MLKFLVNTIFAAVIVAAVAELGKRSTYFAALTIALPITSILALSFLYAETGDVVKVADLSVGIFWLVLPTLLFFLLLPALLRWGWNFWIALPAASAAMVGIFWAYSWALGKLGVRV
jgi:hypothetical protein